MMKWDGCGKKYLSHTNELSRNLEEELMGSTKIQIQDIRCAMRRFETGPPGWQNLMSWRSYQTRIGLC